jgi:tetratricopeptide (TPR) repeat protein
LLPALIDPTRVVDLTPLRDRGAQAIALWMQERHYRLSRFESAGRLCERALADDSLLALAAIKGGQAASWSHQRERAIRLIQHALTLEYQLPRKYAYLARGLNAWYNGDGDSAVRSLRAALAMDPQWAEPAAALGEVFTHLLPAEAPHDSLARSAFLQAIERDSGFTPPLYHLAQDAIRSGRMREADRLIDQFRRVAAEPDLLRELELMRACLRRPTVWAVSSAAEASAAFFAARSLSAGARQAACADAGFRSVLQSPHSSDAERWGAFLALQGLAVTRHDDSEAISLVDSVYASGKGAVRTAYVLDAVAGARMEAEADSLIAWAGRRYGDHYEKNSNPEALWVLLSWHRERGRDSLVRMVADTLEARAAAAGNPRMNMFARAARAQATLAGFDTAGAIEALQKLGNPGPTGDLGWGFGDALPVERLLLARLLLAKGRFRESILAASVFDHPEPITFLPFVGESLGIRYRAALAMGNRPEADSFRRRLEQLGRVDLINAADPTRR